MCACVLMLLMLLLLLLPYLYGALQIPRPRAALRLTYNRE